MPPTLADKSVVELFKFYLLRDERECMLSYRRVHIEEKKNQYKHHVPLEIRKFSNNGDVRAAGSQVV